MTEAKFFDVMVKQLCSQIHHGGHLLRDFPKTLKIVLGKNRWNEPMWRERVDKDTGKTIVFESFPDFVATPPTAGLGASLDMLRDICRNDLVALDMLDRAMQRGQGNPTGANQHTGGNSENLTVSSNPHINTRQGTLRALRKNAPELHEKVLAGEMTAAQAARVAGIRHPRIAISKDNPASAARSIAKNTSPAFVAELVRLLCHQPKESEE